MTPTRADNLRARVAASTERARKCHLRIHAASLLPHVTVLCCFKLRPNLNERAIENGVVEFLQADGWHVIRVAAEAGMAQVAKRNMRAAEPGELDLVAFEPMTGPSVRIVIQRQPWLIEVKRGDRDLTPEQFERVEAAPQFGQRVLITDESALVRDWLKTRRGV